MRTECHLTAASDITTLNWIEVCEAYIMCESADTSQWNTRLCVHTNQADQLISSGPSHAHFIVEAKSLPENGSEYNQGDWFILENESFCPQGVNTICWWKEREQGKCFISDNIPPKMNRCFFIASSSLYQGKIIETKFFFLLVRQSSWESVITSLVSYVTHQPIRGQLGMSWPMRGDAVM